MLPEGVQEERRSEKVREQERKVVSLPYINNRLFAHQAVSQ